MSSSSSPSSTSHPTGSTASEYETVPVPGGQVRLQPQLVNDIWEAMKIRRAKKMTRAEALRERRYQRAKLGLDPYAVVPAEQVSRKVPSDAEHMSKSQRQALRLMYMYTGPRDKAPEGYNHVPCRVLQKAYENHSKDDTLDKDMEIRKEYAKHVIERGWVMVDPITETLQTLEELPPPKRGRPRSAVATPSALRGRKRREEQRERQRLAAAQNEQEEPLHIAGSSEQIGSSTREEYEAPIQRWSQSTSRLSRSPSETGGQIREHDQPVLFWPPGTRRQRTDLVVVDDDHNIDDEEQQHSSPHEEDTSMNSDTEDSDHGIGKMRSMQDILSALPSYPYHTSSSSAPFPSAFEQAYYQTPSPPQRLRHDHLDIDMNMPPPPDSDSD